MKFLYLVLLLLTNATFSQITSPKKRIVEELKIPIRLSFSYGSICCPADEEYTLEKESKLSLIYLFYKQLGIKVKSGYRLFVGKEGESLYYFSLKELNKKQQEELIQRLIDNYKKKLSPEKQKAYSEAYLYDLINPKELKDIIPKHYRNDEESLEYYRIKLTPFE